MRLVRQWRPPRRWMPTNKNQYGSNKQPPADYVAADRAFAEWHLKGKPLPDPKVRQTHYNCNPQPGLRPLSSYDMVPQGHKLYRCGHYE